MVRSYYDPKHVPDHSTLSRKLSSKRWTIVLERFFQHLVDELPKRSAIVATDATGYSGRKHVARGEARAACFGGLSQGACGRGGGRVRSALVFAHRLERSRQPDIRGSMGQAAVERDANALAHRLGVQRHANKKNARHFTKPRMNYQRIVNFAHHWSNCFAVREARSRRGGVLGVARIPSKCRSERGLEMRSRQARAV